MLVDFNKQLPRYIWNWYRTPRNQISSLCKGIQVNPDRKLNSPPSSLNRTCNGIGKPMSFQPKEDISLNKKPVNFILFKHLPIYNPMHIARPNQLTQRPRRELIQPLAGLSPQYGRH